MHGAAFTREFAAIDLVDDMAAGPRELLDCILRAVRQEISGVGRLPASTRIERGAVEYDALVGHRRHRSVELLHIPIFVAKQDRHKQPPQCGAGRSVSRIPPLFLQERGVKRL